ncbi:MAG: 50S ribosomal protein L22 [Acidimicrobiia bacterium]|nr:50S ribosomal protein L22 [Acidimicrobiia bacterium]MBT8213996.1 50S ribosomal protein L22 [Acidimicrobiia bacterium]NNF69069.1 50S ribosomal protein L22 [Acidimicrobiia bacterium]NNK91144.1 50S ribosomal protein L22 [Acidimicrobiia bacterium]
MKATAHARFVRQSPFKVRRVLDLVRGLPVTEAEHVLALTNRRAADPIKKALKSAVANAEHNLALDADELVVAEAFADEGPTLKRFRPRARGRATRIEKRTSHITIVVSTEEDDD